MAISEANVIQVLLADKVRLTAYIRSIVTNRHLAEDVFQDVSVLALQQRDHFESTAHLENWLRRTARHKSLNTIAKMVNRQVSLDSYVLDLLEPEWESVDRLEWAENIERLEHCIERLPETGRRMLRMRYEQDLSGSAIGKQLGRKASAVYVTLSRMRKALEQCMQAAGFGKGVHDG